MLIIMNLRFQHWNSHFSSEVPSPLRDAPWTTNGNGFQLILWNWKMKSFLCTTEHRGILYSSHEARMKEVLHSRGEKNSNGSVSCQEQYQAASMDSPPTWHQIDGHIVLCRLNLAILHCPASFQSLSSHGISRREQRKLLSASVRSTRFSFFLIIPFRSILTLSIVPLFLIYVSSPVWLVQWRHKRRL